MLPLAARHLPHWLRRHLEKLYTAMLHLALLRRVVPMPAVTEHAEISLEAFLPHVTQGVIGGLSNTIWGSLYFGLPYYNCVDTERRSQSPNELLGYKNPSNFIDLNLEFFGVPYCHGDLARGSRGPEIVTEQDRQGDFVAAVLAELDSATPEVAAAGTVSRS
jgi:hypothetical protein